MVKTRNEIAGIYRIAYPDLEEHYCIIMSEELLIPSFDKIVFWANKYATTDIPFKKNIADCEKHSWFFINAIHKERAIKSIDTKKGYTLATGWLTGIKYGLIGETPHTIVTALTDKGIKNIEPRTNVIEGVDITDFNALLLVM